MAQIKPLAACPDYAPVLAYWSYNLWYRTRPIDYDVLVKSYRQRTTANTIPLAWAAVDESMPVGMVSLKNDDLWARKDLNPWLASLFVVPEFRRRGIAEELVAAVIGKARDLKLTMIYLFLDAKDETRLAEYYKARGWRYLEDALDNEGHPTQIFFFPL
ncbi:MAG: GNAT family N-acetyltransferase [Spirochaetes bacterium]|nr:MAG: GNAT family N-acetyltransferase [Spirochaetota bacterium]